MPQAALDQPHDLLTVNLYKAYASNATPIMILSDEVRTVPCNSSGTVTSFTGLTTNASIYESARDVSSTFSYTTAATGCTITGTNTRTITVTAMSADSASVVFTATKGSGASLITVTKTYRLTKSYAGAAGEPGAPGAPGGAGTRGATNISYGVAGLSAWNDTYANQAITNAGLTKVTRDQVTLYNSTTPASFSEARFWDGSAWQSIAAYINGGLLVNGTISANKLVADSITAAQIASGTITADEIAVGSITIDKLKASSTTLTSGYRFSLGQGGSIPVGTTTANAVILAVSTTWPVFAGLFESKNGSQALVCATPVIGSQYGRDATYAVEGWECEPFIAIRARDSNYTAQWHHSAYLAQGKCSATFVNYSRINALSSYTGGAWVGKHPPDQLIQLGLDVNFTNSASTQLTMGGAWSSYSRNTAAYTKSGGEPRVVLSGYINYMQGTGAAGTSDSNMAALFECRALNPSVWGALNYPPTVAQIRFCQDDSYSGTATGKAIWVTKGTSLWDAGAGSLYTNGQLANFTGAHGSLYSKTETIEPGDIVLDTSTIIHGDINNALSVVTKSTAPMQKAVLGVFVGEDTEYIPFEISENVTREHKVDTNNPADVQQLPVKKVVKAEYQELYNNSKVCLINALGEGLINVCGENGNIEIGDYIVTSSIAGKGMKQSDDLMRNYTVAKSRENVTFSSPTEVKMIACTYHCG